MSGSSNIEIREVAPVGRELKRYVQFGIDLYKGNDYFVPPLVSDEVESLMPSRNPAYDMCESKSFMAWLDGRPAGRMTVIINRLVNERSGRREARFGFTDFIDDNRVVDALFAAGEKWARDKGMTEMIGPMGFSDMDHEGMLIEGFEEMGTMATIYNYPYYPVHMERMGYTKDTDWVEYRIKIPGEIPAKMVRIANIVKEKYGLKVVKFTSRKKLAAQYGEPLFHLINKAYDQLYGYSPLSDRQIQYYIGKYLGILRLDCVSVIVDADDKLVGIGISVPSFSMALRKARGRMLPFGWYHLLKAMFGRNEVVDLLLVAISPEYQNKGANALLFSDLIPVYMRNGFKYAESNIELEDNASVQMQWQYFERRQHRRRRAYRKQISPTGTNS